MPWVLRAMISAVSHRQRVTSAVGIHFSNATKILQNNSMPARGVKTDNDGRNELFEWCYRGRCIKIKTRSRKKLWEIVKTFRIPIVRGEHARTSTRSVTYWSRSAAQPLVVATRRRRTVFYSSAGGAGVPNCRAWATHSPFYYNNYYYYLF